MRPALLALLGAIGLVTASAAGAAALPPPGDGKLADQPLFVELVVNGVAKGDIVTMKLAGADPIIAAADLRAAGLAVAGNGPIDLATVQGMSAHYDAAAQVLAIDASPDLLPTSRINGEKRVRAPTVANYGAMLNYDAYGQRSGGITNISIWTEQRLFGPMGVFSNSGTLRWTQGSFASGAAHGYLRYDTRFRYVDENRALSYTAGDLITQSLPWTTSVRAGGIQVARDYRVRPDLITMPLPSFAGQTAVPSAVDLFIDGYRQKSTDIAPGRFLLNNIPVVDGAGQATIVTTDAVGRQVATTIPFYVAGELLKPGLLDISGEIGALRRGYGIRSFDYGAAMASLTARRGITPKLTLEAHGEATKRLGLAGAGLVWAPGLWGVLDLSAAISRTAGHTGRQITAGYSYTSRRFGIAIEHMERTSDYRDLGSFDLANYQGTRRSDRVVATVAMPGGGSAGIAYLDGRAMRGPRTRILSASYSRTIGHVVQLFLGVDHDFSARSSSAQLRLILPFGRNAVSAGISHDQSRGTLYQADYARAVPTGGGLGITASAATDGQGHDYGQFDAQWRTRVAQVEIGASHANGQNAEWAGITGALVTMDRAIFAANQVADAFAVVSTNGVKGVPITYENQTIGTTDKRGHLFVPTVSAYHPGRFALDPLGLAIDQIADTVEQHVALRAGVGAIVHMPVRQARGATVALVDHDGKPLQPGGRAIADGGAAATIGWDGIVYLPDIGAITELAVTRRDGGACHASFALPPGLEALAQIGPVPCI